MTSRGALDAGPPLDRYRHVVDNAELPTRRRAGDEAPLRGFVTRHQHGEHEVWHPHLREGDE